MKLVIEIDEENYEKNKYGRCPVTVMRKSIRNGIPLPKGHGRLGELDILRAKIFIASTDKYFMPTKLLTCDDVTDIIDGMPTIIEADKEG